MKKNGTKLVLCICHLPVRNEFFGWLRSFGEIATGKTNRMALHP